MEQILRAIELILVVGWVGQPGVRGRLAETLIRDALVPIRKDLE
jgi:hypothetical protein